LLAIAALLDGAWFAGFALAAGAAVIVVHALREYAITVAGLRSAVAAVLKMVQVPS
jgi:hypothetical protein